MRPILYFLLILMLAFQGMGQDLNIQQNVRFLALGDSYTIGQSVTSNARWPNQLRDSLVQRGIVVDTVSIIATTGWTTGNLLNAITSQSLDSKNFNLVSVLIGVNNQYQGQNISFFKSQYKQLLDSALTYAGGDSNAVFVVSIPDYGYTPFGQGNQGFISSEIDHYNNIKDSITAIYGFKYFNITPISRQGLSNPSLVASDGLHPSEKQYSFWVNLMLEHIDSVMSTNSVLHLNGTNLIAYPNPSHQSITIENLPEGKNCMINIYDLSGKRVHYSSTNESRYPIDLSSFHSGTYLLEVMCQDQRLGQSKFILQK